MSRLPLLLHRTQDQEQQVQNVLPTDEHRQHERRDQHRYGSQRPADPDRRDAFTRRGSRKGHPV